MQTNREGNILQIGDKFRIEPGPRRCVAVATEELLDNSVTAPHYALLVDDTPDGEPPRPGVDAAGEPIELGKEMTYLDWNGAASGRTDSIVFYVYELGDMTEAEVKERSAPDGAPPLETKIWREIGLYETEEAAIGAVFSRAGGAE